MVRANRWSEGPLGVRSVPSPNEDDRLPWPTRRTFRRASRNARLEHDTFSAADSESLSANGRKEPPPSALKREDLVG